MNDVLIVWELVPVIAVLAAILLIMIFTNTLGARAVRFYREARATHRNSTRPKFAVAFNNGTYAVAPFRNYLKETEHDEFVTLRYIPQTMTFSDRTWDAKSLTGTISEMDELLDRYNAISMERFFFVPFTSGVFISFEDQEKKYPVLRLDEAERIFAKERMLVEEVRVSFFRHSLRLLTS